MEIEDGDWGLGGRIENWELRTGIEDGEGFRVWKWRLGILGWVLEIWMGGRDWGLGYGIGDEYWGLGC